MRALLWGLIVVAVAAVVYETTATVDKTTATCPTTVTLDKILTSIRTGELDGAHAEQLAQTYTLAHCDAAALAIRTTALAVATAGGPTGATAVTPAAKDSAFGSLAMADGALKPGDPYGILAALDPLPGLAALGVPGQRLRVKIANAAAPDDLRATAATYDAAGNGAAANDLRRAANYIAALNTTAAHTEEWDGIKALPSPAVGRGLNLVMPLDFTALYDESKPLCPGTRTVDFARMQALSGYGRPVWADTDEKYLAWLLALTRTVGSDTTAVEKLTGSGTHAVKVFPDGPLYIDTPNALCPDLDQVQTFIGGLLATDQGAGPWMPELFQIARRLGAGPSFLALEPRKPAA